MVRKNNSSTMVSTLETHTTFMFAERFSAFAPER